MWALRKENFNDALFAGRIDFCVNTLTNAETLNMDPYHSLTVTHA